MSERSESTYPESTAGPTSPIFGTASFSTFTTTALTSLWPPSTRRNSRSGSSCGSENEASESGTYQDDQSVAETEEGGIRLVSDEVSNLDEDYEEEEVEEEQSEVSAERNSQFSTDDTLSASYHIQTTSGEYTTTPTRSSLRSFDDIRTPVYTNPYLTSSSEQLAGTLSRTTLTPTYTGTPITHSRSYTTSSLSSRPAHAQTSSQKRTAGELIAFYEQQAHSRAASAPMETGFSRPGSPTKPGSQSYSVPVGMPGALAAPRHDARSWRSGGSGKTLSSWSFESDRSRSPVKGASETGSAPSGTVVSGSSGYTRSGSTRSGYAGGLMSAIGGLVGFSSSSASSRVSSSSRSPSRRGPSPTSTPRRRERTASSPRSAFSQIRRSPKGKAREHNSPRGSPSPTRSRARSGRSATESVDDEATSIHSAIPPPLDVAEYGGSGTPVNSAPVWYYNVHRLPPYTWNYAEGYLFPNMMLLSWVVPRGGRVVVKLDLLSCVEIRTSRAQGASDVRVEREGESHRLQTFELGYGDSIERLGCETRVEMLDWFNSIQSVFNGIMSMTESERANGRPASPAVTVSSFDFSSSSDSVLSAQLRSAPVSGSQSQSYRSREYRPRTPTVPLTEGVLRSSTPPIDTTVSRWRSQALERSSASSDVSSMVEDSPLPAIAQPTIPVTVPTLSASSHSQLAHSQFSHSQFPRTYAPSTSSQTITQSLSSGTLYNGARTIMEIGSSTGTDIVASTLSFRGTASASLLGDSCAPTTIETASTIDGNDRYHRRVAGPGAAQSTSASGYIAEVDEPYESRTALTQPQLPSNVMENVPSGQDMSVPQDQLAGSPAAEQSDSDYVTAASPTASFVSLSGMSAFPDEEEEAIVAPTLPDPTPEDATPVIERPPTPAGPVDVDDETIMQDDLASTIIPLETESTIDDQSGDPTDAHTPIIASHNTEEPPSEPAGIVEVENKPEPEIMAPPPVLRVDASTQADIEIEEPQKDDTPQPELIPLPPSADTVYTPSVKSVGISPIPLVEPLEPESVPGSPHSDTLSTLSGAVPELSQLPKSADVMVAELDVASPSGSLGIVAGTPMPSLTSDSLSDALPTPEPSKHSPSVVESMWPAETDRSYESSVLNASPSLSLVARTSTEYIGIAESPALSEIKTPASLLKAETEVQFVADEDDALTFGSSEVDSADDASTPTASSWVSSLPPSVPSNTLNDAESVPRALSEAEQTRSVDLADATSELSTAAEVSTHPKVFAEEGCQADFVIENPPLSPRLVPLPISRPPSRHEVSIAAVAEKVDGGSSMDSDDVLADRFIELEAKLSSSYSLGSDKIMDHLADMGQTLNKDHIELRNMLIEILENTRSQDDLELRGGGSAKSVASTVATVSQKVDVATSPILVAMVASSTSPPPIMFKEQAISPVLVAKYRDLDANMAHRSGQDINTIMLTPPPRDAATPDTLMETMSYLSSHHSDDISEMDLELSQDPLQVERVSPSWASDSSADSEELSDSGLTEPQEETNELQSVLDSPAPMSPLSMIQEDGSVVEEDHMSGIATEVPSGSAHGVSSIAAGTLLHLPGIQTAVSDVVSLYRSESASGSSAIQMPIPTRAGLPVSGQLAHLMTPESKHVDQGISTGYSEIGASYTHQATSPLQEIEPALSPSVAATFVDKEVDSTLPESQEPIREEKSVTTHSEEAYQEESIDAVLVEGREEKSIDTIGDDTHEEKAVCTLLETREEKAVDTTSEDMHEEKSVDALAPPVVDEKAVEAHVTEETAEKGIEANSTGEEVEIGIDALPESILEDKSVDALQTAVLEEKAVDAIPELVSEPAVYAEKDCDTADLNTSSAISSDDVAILSVVDLPETVTQDAEVQAADLTKMLVPPLPMLSSIGHSDAPPTVVLPTFLQDQPTFSAHMKDIMSSGLSPALENVALLVYENRMARDEFKRANEDYERMVRDEFKKAHEDYRQSHEESILRIQEMYRIAQDEMMQSLAQMKDLVSQLMSSQKPVSVSVSVPQQHSYPIPPGFVPNAVPEQAGWQQPSVYPAAPAGSYSQPVTQQPIFMPTPEIAGMPPPPNPTFISREAPVVPSPPPLSPTLSESSGTTSSSATPTLASMHILPTGYAVEPSTVARGAMVPLPPSPIPLSPQPLHLPFTSQTTTRDLPVVPEMASEESPVMLQPSLTGVVHASEYVQDSQHMDNSESSEPDDETDRDILSETPVIPMQETELPDVIPEPVQADPVAVLEPPSEPMEDAVQEPATTQPANADDIALTVDDATCLPAETGEPDDDAGDGSQSDMSGLTTPSQPSTPAEPTTRALDVSALGLQEPDSDPAVSDPSHESVTTPAASHALAHEIEASIAAAASDLKSVVEAARGATEGALAASKEAQSMLESVRAQRDELSRELEECTREREAAKADRDEASALREQTMVEAAAEREQAVAERDARIEELQQELEAAKAKEIELETSQAGVVSERDARIQALEEELGAVRSELEEQKEVRLKEQAERESHDAEREKAQAEATAEHEARIASLEEELSSLRAAQEEERQAHAAQGEQHQKALEDAASEREREVSERDSRIQALEQELETMRSEHDEEQRRRETEQAERDEAMAERERSFNETAAERDAHIESLQSELNTLREETERQREEHVAAIAKLEETQQASEEAHAETVADHQRQIEERDQRISALEEDLARLRSDHEAELLQRAAEVEALNATWNEQEKAHNEASAERDERIKALEEQLSEVRAEHEQTLQQRDLQDTERHAAWDEREQALQEAAADRDSRISELEAEISSLRAEREQEKQLLAEQQAARVQRERELTEEALERERLSSERQDSRIKELTDELAALRAEREQERERREIEEAERREADRAEARELAESQAVKLTGIQEKLEQLAEQSTDRFSTVDTRLEKIAEESTEKFAGIDTKLEKIAEESMEKFGGMDARLEKMSEESVEKFSGVDARFASMDTKFDKLMEESTERSTSLDSKLDKLVEESTERSNALDSKLDKITEESVERHNELDSKLDKLVESSGEQFTDVNSKIEKLAESSTEQFQNVETRFATVEQLSTERFTALDSQLEKMTESSTEKFAAVEGQLAKLDEEAVRARELHEQEMAEAAAKPTVEALFDQHIAMLKAQVQEQIDALQNDLRTEGSRQHEEVIANVRATIEEQSAMLVTTCLDELGKLLESIGAQQQAEILSAMRVTIQEQVTFNISYYLDELTKMFDAHGVRQLAETIEAVRATAREQVPYNTEGHLTDFCKNLAPEMLQLFQEIKEKAEEKSRLDRQIDILRRHKHDYEAGDLRGDEYTDAIPVPPPQQIHVSRSDADLHKAWRGRSRPTRRGENPTEIPYSQTGSHSHHSIYPDQWSRDSFDQGHGSEVVLLPPQEDPMMPSRSPNGSYYHN